MLSQKYTAFPHLSDKHMELMLSCLTVCSSCAEMCLKEGRKETAKLCLDCADICGTTIKLHSRESEFNPKIMSLCADICKRCSEECSKVKMDHCQQCSELCAKCAEACAE